MPTAVRMCAPAAELSSGGRSAFGGTRGLVRKSLTRSFQRAQELSERTRGHEEMTVDVHAFSNALGCALGEHRAGAGKGRHFGDAISEGLRTSAFSDALAKKEYAFGDTPSAMRRIRKDKIIGAYAPPRRTSNRRTPSARITPSANIAQAANIKPAMRAFGDVELGTGGKWRRRNSTFKHASARNGEA
ncbi:hypothetical protein AXG93_1995s1040 [Marchantia polymorpha subsp. ruderalis]|uniref:Uncharacterized protein n=1 Tax=Marchantia polymorpha subsp. ruderalis TaxID=1480154 RepID=A0A176VFS0_MARPO|nr:hypothetical protein AXG93_1995s1040 [Marchantia polymorpha subsp. ruderalis]